MFLSCLVIYCSDYVILLTELLVFNSNCEKYCNCNCNVEYRVIHYLLIVLVDKE